MIFFLVSIVTGRDITKQTASSLLTINIRFVFNECHSYTLFATESNTRSVTFIFRLVTVEFPLKSENYELNIRVFPETPRKHMIIMYASRDLFSKTVVFTEEARFSVFHSVSRH